MKTLKKIIVFLFLSIPVLVKAETKEIPFTLDDRDRIIRSEKSGTALRELPIKIFEYRFLKYFPTEAFPLK